MSLRRPRAIDEAAHRAPVIVRRSGRCRVATLTCVLVLGVIACGGVLADSNGCTGALSVEGDVQRKPTNWKELYQSYERYRSCDDGALAEAYSDYVAYLLARKWSEVKTLAVLARAHPDFETFVLRHVDEMMSPEQAKTIQL